ncbi:MAG TPA: nucleotidyltransferase domain-containing protein [Terriglobia bacterium]|nr:nucleotidyltransferase domain-containing protein [Terriglobia bacterium]
MDKSTIIATLRDHQAELEAASVVHLRLHGSVARGDASDNSDVDLIADFDAARKYSLLDRVALENRLAEMLGTRVDLSPSTTLKDPVRRKADREAVLAF